MSPAENPKSKRLHCQDQWLDQAKLKVELKKENPEPAAILELLWNVAHGNKILRDVLKEMDLSRERYQDWYNRYDEIQEAALKKESASVPVPIAPVQDERKIIATKVSITTADIDSPKALLSAIQSSSLLPEKIALFEKGFTALSAHLGGRPMIQKSTLGRFEPVLLGLIRIAQEANIDPSVVYNAFQMSALYVQMKWHETYRNTPLRDLMKVVE